MSTHTTRRSTRILAATAAGLFALGGLAACVEDPPINVDQPMEESPSSSAMMSIEEMAPASSEAMMSNDSEAMAPAADMAPGAGR